MNTSVQFSIREILAVSRDVGIHLHDQIRKNQIPIFIISSIIFQEYSDSSIPVTVVDFTELVAYFTLSSGCVEVNLGDQRLIDATLDNDSEISMMPHRTFGHLEIPIDNDVHWSINAYNTRSEIEAIGLIEVSHDILISIGGVGVKQHIFVEHSNSDLILDRPQERAVKAVCVNEDDDGTYRVYVQSLDGCRHAVFTAIKAQYERNHLYVRSNKITPLKV